ncbi:peptidoglycan transpeptidase precursor, ErfK-YbiS-YhnG family [Bacillus sp. OV166]|uniref:L,D-transpeptidase family protein n=1 Tax=Bacillus sp. OV166 TaxID=1882763 RepID=UPI000A2AAEFF|nr:L,D-transpeptidase family protein [Bacillus sp. OV166]SMQ84931.1 peptidoglycan transpeptidase precursor, ErfK-YbiS-YhnG family [Bacillus sp. OV166]
MENAVKESVEEIGERRAKSFKWYTNWKFITTGIIIIIALIFGAISYYQANHFNANIKINGVNVNGLTADEALNKLNTSVLKNVVYVGKQQIFDGQDTKMGFTDKDLAGVKKLLSSQRTYFPSSKAKEFSLMPSQPDQYRSQEMKKQVEEKLLSMNKSLTAPKDAKASLEQGKVVVSKSNDGQQLDFASLLKDYEKQGYTSEIRLNPVYIQPIKTDSPIVKNEQKRLEELLLQTVDYKVQDKVFSLKGSELIKNASVTKDLKVTIDPSDINEKIAEINSSQSTLDKDFTFKTHSGAVKTVKGKGYGWALDVDKETTQIKKAFEKGEKSIAATNIIGHGWSGEGYGYETTSNNGIGDTYAEVSIAQQRIWIYKNGKLVVTSNVVTGKHSTGHDTSKGVWYILYKRTPSILTGRELGGSPGYSVKVNYWAPFTNDGQGFHDAGFRSNWSSQAYLNAGSHGCVNTPPDVMKTVYNNLSTYEPVVIY